MRVRGCGLVSGVLFVLATLHVPAAAAQAAPADAPPPSPEPSAEARDIQLWQLALHFQARAMHYRAITVFEELAFTTHDPALRERARFGEALSYQLGGQASAAVAEYDRLLDAQALPALTPLLLVQRDVAAFQAFTQGQTAGSADHLAAQLEPLTAAGSPAAPWARYHVARIRLFEGQNARARATALPLRELCARDSHAICPSLPALEAALDHAPPSTRSPWLGAFLSLVVPGLGSAYSAHYVDAAYYFTLTAGPLLLAANVYDDRASFADQRAAVYVLGGFAALTYLASIVQGYVTALRYDEVSRYEQEQRVLDATPASLPLTAADAAGQLR